MRSLLLASVAAIVLSGAARGQHFYPPLPTAKSAIDFDAHGFLIHGQRTWIFSAGIEYARVPHELWRDRLLKIKRAGFNCVEIYAFWNYHEIAPDQWDFTGDKDVGKFLDLAHELGLYVTVRVGPYVCAEWENGGFPNWLRFMPGLRTRQDEPNYLGAVDGWYDHILPIVASHQISRGGGVIMIQLENEDDEGWGAWNLDPVRQSYFKHLLDKARAQGIDVLTFFSGMNHGGDPAPKEPIRSADQHDPWYTTEYWSGWYNQYGNFVGGDKDALTHYDRAAWRFLENGANGFNIYMFHGGSNFDHWNNNETAASYDYAGAIGQAGDLRPIYYKYKRVAMFAHSFQDILENCDDATPSHANEFPGLTVRARTGPAGTIVFLDNPGDKPVDASFPDGQVLTLAPGEVTGLVRDYPLGSAFHLATAETRILALVPQGKTTDLVVYGPAGSSGRLSLDMVAKAGRAASGTDADSSSMQVDLAFPRDGQPPAVTMLSNNGRGLQVIALNNEQADRTYLIDGSIVVGAPYVGVFTPPAHLAEQLPIDATTSPEVFIYGPGGAKTAGKPSDGVGGKLMEDDGHEEADQSSAMARIASAPLPPIDLTAPALTDWQSAPASAEIAPGYDDSRWFDGLQLSVKESRVDPRAALQVQDPPAMGADGDGSPFAWYRTTIHVDAAGTQYLQVPYLADQAEIWLNGQRVNGHFLRGPASIPLELKAGDNTLAIFTSHNGRTKLGNYGSIEHVDVKGLVGPVLLVTTDSPFVPLTDCVAKNWWKDPPPVGQLIGADVDTSQWDKRNFQGDWGGTAVGSWRAPFVCIRATLPDIAGPNRVLRVGFFDEKATFYLNGQKVGAGHNVFWDAAHPRFYDPASAMSPAEDTLLVNAPFDPLDPPLDAAWKDGGPNVLTVILENSHQQATLGGVMLTSGDPGLEVKGWKMRGGVTPYADKSLAWQPAPANPTHKPTYYRATFTVPADYGKQAVPVLRLSTQGLSRGSVWLNGHNLGRYPEKIQIDGPWLPECWIKPGENELVVLDEEGAAITPAHLWIETDASWRLVHE